MLDLACHTRDFRTGILALKSVKYARAFFGWFELIYKGGKQATSIAGALIVNIFNEDHWNQ